MRTSICFIFLLLSFTFISSIEAQETDSEGVSKEVEEFVSTLNDRISDGDWQEVRMAMTQKAWKDFCLQTLGDCTSVNSIELGANGIDIPGLAETQETIRPVLQRQGLEDLRFNRSSVALDADAKAKRSENLEAHRNVLGKLDEDERLLEVIADLYEAKLSSPSSFSAFGGKALQQVESEDGFMVKVGGVSESSPQQAPAWLNLKRDGVTLKYVGLNRKKTLEESGSIQPPRSDKNP